MDDPRTHEVRLEVLGKCLAHPSHYVRDGAGLGIASTDDPRGIFALRRAIEREHCPELREDLELVLAQLEETRDCRTS